MIITAGDFVAMYKFMSVVPELFALQLPQSS